MQSLTQFILENFSNKNRQSREDEKERYKDSEFRHEFKARGWKFIPTIHASVQAMDRRPDMDEKKWKAFHLNVVSKLQDRRRTTLSKHVLFFSKSKNQGYICEINYSKKIIKIITVLPRGKGAPKKGTDKIIFENIIFPVEIVD